HAQFDAFIADEHGRSGNEFTDLVLALAAERTIQGVLGVASADLAHKYSLACLCGQTFQTANMNINTSAPATRVPAPETPQVSPPRHPSPAIESASQHASDALIKN